MHGCAQAAALLGGLVGPAVGGLLADTAGLRAPFTLTGCAALAAALYGAVRLPETVGLRSRGGAQEEVAQQEEVCLGLPSSTADVHGSLCPSGVHVAALQQSWTRQAAFCMVAKPCDG